MPVVSAGGRGFDVDVVVFDKDDTLVDLNATWGPVAIAWVDAVADGDGPLADELATRLGLDRATGRVIPESVFATHTVREIGEHTARIVAAHGWSDDLVASRLATAQRDVMVDAASLVLVPLADLVAVFTGLRTAGLGVGVFTSDDRAPTESFLRQCAVLDLVDVIVSGDEVDRPKPNGEGLRRIAARSGTTTDRLLMVGDSRHDLGAARDAGAWFVAVGEHSAAAPHADAHVADVGAITTA